jgi:Pyridoxamine 5'-phosphate oxidase
MATDYPSLDAKLRKFIASQHIFFTATAAENTRINISPRSTEWLRVIDDNAAVYLDKTGSGMETAAHTLHDGRITLMLCAFDKPPMILRLYGQGRAIFRGSDEYAAHLAEHFGNTEPLGARQMIRIDFDLVKTSCGYGVPFFEFTGERDTLDRWAEAKGPEGIVEYRAQKNVVSMDGLSTGYPVETAVEPAE